MKFVTSVRFKILISVILVILFFNLFSFLLLRDISNKAARFDVSNDLSHMMENVAEIVSSENAKEFAFLRTIAQVPQIRDENVGLYEKSQIIYDFYKINQENYFDMCILDTNGNAYIKGTKKIVNFSERAYFQEPMKGNDWVVDPFLNKVDGRMAIFYAVPVYNESGNIINVVFSVVDGYKFCNKMKSFIVGKNSTPKIFNGKNGNLVASVEADSPEEFVNLSEIEGIKAHKDRIMGEAHGSEEVKYSNSKEKQILTFAEIPNSEWKIVATAPLSDFNQTYRLIQNVMMIQFSVVLLVASVIVLLVLRKVLRPLKVVAQTIDNISNGEADLTQRISYSSNDEIGSVVAGFNRFIEMIQKIIQKIEGSKGNLMQNGEMLVSITDKTSESVQEITTQLNVFNQELENQGNSVEDTINGIHGITSDIKNFNNVITAQVEGVSRASNAVNQMMQNISGVDDSVHKMSKSFEIVLENTKSGNKMQEDVNQKIKEIEVESESLKEANIVIAEIAEQTNLLAMNAAIEAAHAGESGKGFAVVADEIRKLSENSTEQSQTIGAQLHSIEELIEQVVQSSEETSNVFSSVILHIDETNAIIQKMLEALSVQEESSSDISKTLTEMNDSTATVQKESAQMLEKNRQVIHGIEKLQNSTMDMKISFMEMKKRTEIVNDVSNELNNVTSSIKGSIDNIGEQIDLFEV